MATERGTLPASSCLLLLTFHSLTCFPSAPISCLLLELHVSFPLSPDHWIQCRIGQRGVSSREKKDDLFHTEKSQMPNPMVILQLNSVWLMILFLAELLIWICVVPFAILCGKCLGTGLLKQTSKQTQNPTNANKPKTLQTQTNSKIPQNNYPHPTTKNYPKPQMSNFSVSIYSPRRHEFFSSFRAIN